MRQGCLIDQPHADVHDQDGVANALRIATEPEWQAQFQGATDEVSVTKDGGTINAITGSTITSRAVCDGVNAARAVVEALG